MVTMAREENQFYSFVQLHTKETKIVCCMEGQK